MIKVLVIEDVVGLRQHAIKLALEAIPDVVVAEAENGLEGLKLARTINPDLIIMDISMPEMNGIKAAQQIWSETPARKILFWSQYHREAYVRELGKIVPDDAIHGYALKSETDEKFIEAMRSVLMDEIPYIDPVVRGVQARLKSRDQSLTDIEFESLLDIATGLTDKAIALRRHISVRGVQNRISMLSDKLLKGSDGGWRETAGMEVFNPRTRLVFVALKRGLIDPDDVASLEKGIIDWLSGEFEPQK